MRLWSRPDQAERRSGRCLAIAGTALRLVRPTDSTRIFSPDDALVRARWNGRFRRRVVLRRSVRQARYPADPASITLCTSTHSLFALFITFAVSEIMLTPREESEIIHVTFNWPPCSRRFPPLFSPVKWRKRFLISPAAMLDRSVTTVSYSQKKAAPGWPSRCSSGL